MLVSCEEKGLLVNSNDTAYLRFANDMTKDTTTVSFKMYNEGEDAEIPIEVSVYGQIQEDDLHFNVSVDAEYTTLPADLYVLPTDCRIRKGLLTDTIYVILKNAPMLEKETKILALQVVEANGVKQGDHSYSRAFITVTDRLFKPHWWSVIDAGSESNPGNSVDWFYLGEYSERKYQMFLDELKKDDMVFDGKNKQVLRKYSLRLKNTLKQMNEGKKKEDWEKDEHGNVITVEVAG
ncbi:DUF4843 domain-containing protein [Bacteroides xylanisolvens]|nr:DUF4843 domain-containing protein [Bacteroides xylanisolvens]